MTWLVDTNSLTEIRKGARCHPGVAACWAGVEDRDLFLSALTLGEIRWAIKAVRPRDPGKAAAPERWLRDVAEAFGPRILGADPETAEAWGRLSAIRSDPVIDALLAATAQMHDLVLVTRNMADVEGLGVKTLSPFSAAA